MGKKTKVGMGAGLALAGIGAYLLVRRRAEAEEPPPDELPVEGISFTVSLTRIPGYAAASYQWYITYVGKHGMIDPQAGIWTPIDLPIFVENVPASGKTLQATLMAGPYQVWNFTVIRTFEDNEVFAFDLLASIEPEPEPEPEPPPPDYPDITEPEVVSAEWLPKAQWKSGYFPEFQGTIRLPYPGVDQRYMFRGLLGGVDVGWTDIGAHISQGVWNFKGSAPMEYFPSMQQCLLGYKTTYWASCGICPSYWSSGDTAAQARAAIGAHFIKNCYEGMTSHCGEVIIGEEWTTQEPQYYLTDKPCIGTRLTLALDVILTDWSGDVPYTVSTWESIPTGLSYTVS